MAKKVTVALVDDYDGESTATETVTFALDGNTYEIDLSDKHGTEIRDDLRKWIKHARKVSGRTIRRRPTGANANNGASDIRTWAIANGYEVPKRGRMKAEVFRAYNAAQAANTETDAAAEERPAARRSKKTADAVEFSAANA